jgi:DNA (cytosine-5)-methyltransferase 1
MQKGIGEMNELALFAGAGGGILGGKLLGWRTVCAVEWEKYPACVLAARQNDGLLESFPIWDDVQTFDGKPWRGIVDVVSGGFPCQDISQAGKGVGIGGERSGMWSEMARIIGEVRPKYAFIENSPMLTSRGLERVLADLASMGFNAEWGVLGAGDVGAPHLRKRIWIVGRHTKWQLANTNLLGHIHGQPKVNTTKRGVNALRDLATSSSWCGTKRYWSVEPNVGRVVDGLADRMDRLKALGNGQVPLCAATAWNILNERLDNKTCKDF